MRRQLIVFGLILVSILLVGVTVASAYEDIIGNMEFLGPVKTSSMTIQLVKGKSSKVSVEISYDTDGKGNEKKTVEANISSRTSRVFKAPSGAVNPTIGVQCYGPGRVKVSWKN